MIAIKNEPTFENSQGDDIDLEQTPSFDRGHITLDNIKVDYECPQEPVFNVETIYLKQDFAIPRPKSNLRVQKNYLRCNMCTAKFIVEKRLIEHVNKVHRDYNPPFECDYCKKMFDDKKKLTGHVYNLHVYRQIAELKKVVYNCEFCHRTFPFRYKLNQHLKVHKKPYQCDHCKCNFIRKDSMSSHIILKHLHCKPYSCSICGRQFATKQLHKIHMERHSKGLRISVKPNVSELPQIQEGQAKSYQCTICMKKYKMPSQLFHHMNRHIGIKQFECEICKKKFFTKKNLSKHHTSVHAEKKFQCDYCGQLFTIRGNLSTHIKIKHLKEQNFISDKRRIKLKKIMCDNCGKLFHCTSDLTQHVIMTHQKGSEAYLKRLNQKREAKMKRQEEMKKNPKYYHCEFCPKIYTNSSVLSKHKVIHRPKEFHCNLCSKSFHYRNAYEYHMQSHLRKSLKNKEKNI